MKQFFFLSSFLLISFIANSQSKSINNSSQNLVASKASFSGFVYDATTKKPIVGTTVFVYDAKVGAISTNDGSFKTQSFASGSYLVEISSIGYATIIEQISFFQNIEKNFYLQESAVEQDAVTVTGTTTATKISTSAQPVSIVKRKDLFQLSSTNIIDAIGKKVPGFATLNTGPAISKPIIRGLGYNRIVTINDGARQEGQQWGDEHGIEIDDQSIQRAEVLKGASSLMYGSDALGGVLNLITNAPIEQNTSQLNIQMQTNTNNRLHGLYVNHAANYKSGFNYNMYASIKSAADYQNKYDGIVFNSRFRENNFGGYLGINKEWGFSHLIISNFNQKLGIVEGARDAVTGQFTIFPETAYERIATDKELKSRSFTTPYQGINHFKIASDNSFDVGSGRITLNIAHQTNKRKEFGDPDNLDVPALFFDLKTTTLNLQYHKNIKNGWKTSFGINGMNQQNKNLAEEVIIPAYKQFDIGAFIFIKKTFNEKLHLTTGIRTDFRTVETEQFLEGIDIKFDEFKKTFSNITGSIGATYQANKTLNLKLNIARGFRAPTVSELSSNGAHEGTNRYEYGDKNLQSETSLQLDGGIEINTPHLSVALNLFANKINNYIFYSKLEAVGGGDSLIDVGGEMIQAFTFKQSNTNFIGFETMIDFHPHPLDWLHFQNTFSYVRAMFDDPIEGNKNVPFIPAARLISELRADVKKLGKNFKNAYFKVELDNTFTQNNVFTAFDTETATNGFSLLNIGLGFDVINKKNITVCNFSISLNNLTDISYQNHLSRLKYAQINNVTGRQGVFNMGRNIGVKLNIPLSFKHS